MNQLLLLAGLRVWSGTAVEKLTRFFGALSFFALEMQLATWTGLATLTSLVPVNAIVAVGLFVWQRRADRERPRDHAREMPLGTWWPFAALGVLVIVLNFGLPLEAADPYHLERVDRIERTGTLAHDPGAHAKLNVLGWLYELTLADLRTVPLIGPSLVHLHGAIGLALYALTCAAVFQIFGVVVPSAGALLAVVPVVFHQFVIVKNDLFGGIPALLALAWLVAEKPDDAPMPHAWTGWLTGIAVGVKLTSFPSAVILGAAVLWDRWRAARIVAAVVGGICGLVAAGLLFVLVENVSVYGSALTPFAGLDNRTTGPGDAAVSVGRFAISLLDMGLVTRTWWPGRGGWAGTYGLPLSWALCVLAAARRTPLARRTLIVCAAYWLAFAAVYPDADIAHRLALAPGLLAVAAAATVAGRDPAVPRWLLQLSLPVGVLSAAQIVRSAVLYFGRT